MIIILTILFLDFSWKHPMSNILLCFIEEISPLPSLFTRIYLVIYLKVYMFYMQTIQLVFLLFVNKNGLVDCIYTSAV